MPNVLHYQERKCHGHHIYARRIHNSFTARFSLYKDSSLRSSYFMCVQHSLRAPAFLLLQGRKQNQRTHRHTQRFNHERLQFVFRKVWRKLTVLQVPQQVVDRASFLPIQQGLRITLNQPLKLVAHTSSHPSPTSSGSHLIIN